MTQKIILKKRFLQSAGFAAGLMVFTLQLFLLRGYAQPGSGNEELLNAEIAVNQEESSGTPAAAVPEEEGPNKIEINGDRVEFLMAENKVIAEGNVSVRRQDVTLFCDRLEYARDAKLAMAEGHIRLLRKEGQLEGERMKFNFGTMKGDFIDAEFDGHPFRGAGKKISRVDDGHIVIDDGYITTCDLDHPHFRFFSKKVDLYPQEKATAKNVQLKVGNVPIMYLPRFTQDLKDRKPVFMIIPGYKKDWGAFALGQYRYHLTEKVKGVIHMDYRTQKGLAEGVDLEYQSEHIGSGILRTYYMNERDRGNSKIWEDDDPPTVERERYKIEYRHNWKIDERTQAVGQYYKLSDADFLKMYFEREYDRDPNPDTYFLLTRNLDYSTLSFRTDVRVNRFVDAVERLPEIGYTLPDVKIGDTGFYFKDSTTYSNLDKKTASPSEIRQKTMRLDTENILSYPFKISFIQLRPFAGGRQTYYSRTADPGNSNSVRTIFKTGSDLSAKFFRVFDLKTNKFGLDINRLRHVVTPSLAYYYDHQPSISADELDQYDSVDALDRAHGINFSLENKLQTKRDDKNVDLVRLLLGSDFHLKENPGTGGFYSVTADLDVKPYQWLSLYLDSEYDSLNERLKTLNSDLYFNDPKGKWYWSIGKRYAVEVDDEITTEWGYTINPKWKFITYQRLNVDNGKSLEQQYTLRRDLHCWMMDLSINKKQDGSSEFWLVFTLKEFPEMGVDFSTTFNRRKPGESN